jgi:hypothetical protein
VCLARGQRGTLELKESDTSTEAVRNFDALSTEGQRAEIREKIEILCTRRCGGALQRASFPSCLLRFLPLFRDVFFFVHSGVWLEAVAG